MPENTIRLSFIKLAVPELEEAKAFWSGAFGFSQRGYYDEPEFLESIMSIPEQEAGPSLMLLQYKDGRDITVGGGHGPIGLTTTDIVTTLESALAAGGTKTMEITEVVPGVRVCLLVSPQGHEVELVQAGGG